MRQLTFMKPGFVRKIVNSQQIRGKHKGVCSVLKRDGILIIYWMDFEFMSHEISQTKKDKHSPILLLKKKKDGRT